MAKDTNNPNTQETEELKKLEELAAENEALKKQLQEAHEEIAKAEEKAPEAPVITIDGKKYRLTIPKGLYPVGKREHKEVTAETLRKDKKLAKELVKNGYAGLELVKQ